MPAPPQGDCATVGSTIEREVVGAPPCDHQSGRSVGKTPYGSAARTGVRKLRLREVATVSPRHQRPRGAVRGSARRALVWATTDQGVTLAAGASSNINLLAGLSVAGSSILGCTIMRTHCEISITSAVSTGDELRVGFVVGRLAEVGAGVAGALTAATPELDWMLWRHECAAPTFGWTSANNQLVYDIKSKRKMQELSQAYILTLSNDAGISKTMQIQARTLIALP